MRRLLMVVIALVVCVLCFGVYRGWFGVTTDGAGSQHHITFSVDEDKIKADEKRAVEHLPSSGHSTTDGAATPHESGKN